MKTLSGHIIFALVMSFTALAFPQTAGNEGIINRRDQARGAFLSVPHEVFQHYCAHCHGESGQGEGRLWASELSPKPADLTASELDKEALIKFISQGSEASGYTNLCPPWGRTISSQNITRLAQHIFALRGGEAAPLSSPQIHSESANEPTPWLLISVVMAEIVIVWLLMKRRKVPRTARDIHA